MALSLPASHQDLFSRPVHGVLTTLMPGGQPQSSIVWVDYDGESVLINTTLERQKGRNVRSDPRVTLLVVDPRDGSRWIEVRGAVTEIVREGAEAHADKLTARYLGRKHFYGDVYTVDRRNQETRVIMKIEPTHVALDAVFR